MSGDRCIDIREIEPGTWRLEFPYEADFIAYVKSRARN
jgi:hypothetical protein